MALCADANIHYAFIDMRFCFSMWTNLWNYAEEEKATDIWPAHECVLHMTLGFGSNNKQWLMLPLITATFAFCVHSKDLVWQCYFAIYNPMPTQNSFSMQNSMEIFYKLVVGITFLLGHCSHKDPHQKFRINVRILKYSCWQTCTQFMSQNGNISL